MLQDSNLIQQLSEYSYNLSAELEKALGVNKRRDLLVRHSVVDSQGVLVKVEDEFISPTPRIVIVEPKTDLLFSPNNDTIKPNQEYYLVTSIPITYTYDFLFSQVDFYIIDPVLNEAGNRVVGGIVCDPVMRKEKKIASREFILKQRIDETLPIDYHPV